jgi:tripartite-type tricarboxylate transporter receptor subunit TctC
VTTLAESSVPGCNVEGWVGFYLPAKPPDNILARLRAETAKVLRLPEVRDTVLAAARKRRIFHRANPLR